MKPVATEPSEADRISNAIVILRGQRVLLDRDLAQLYGVETRRLNEQVRRNKQRFPADFIFEVSEQEARALISQFATSSWGGTRKRPLAFTEHGAIMAATVLNSPSAVKMSVFVVRAFVQYRSVLSSTRELAERLDALERHVATKLTVHDRTLTSLLKAIRSLTESPATKTRPIGFTADLSGSE
jgi:hypothetical protein